MDYLEKALRDRMRSETKAYLTRLAQNGARISIEGYHLPIAQMVEMMTVCEGFCYMPDFITDERDRIVGVNFNRVKLS